MDLFSVLSIGVGLSMDAFAISVSNGLCVRRIRLSYALRMAITFGLAQAMMPLLGYTLGYGFTSLVGKIGPYIACAVLLFVGGRMIYESFEQKDDSCEIDAEVSWKTLAIMAIATSIDALVAGVGFAFTPRTPAALNIFVAVSIIGLVTLLICTAGAYIGCFFGGKIKRGAEIFGGAILVLIGIKFLF